MMYESIILMHHWFRWLVLLGGLWLLYFCCSSWYGGKKWDSEVKRLLWSFEQLFGYQVAFGLALYLGVSPVLKMALSNPQSISNDPFTRFWTLIHGPAMLAALIIFQVGKYFVEKQQGDQRKFQLMSVAMFVTMALIILAIPWPFLSYGRPLIRLGFWEF